MTIKEVGGSNGRRGMIARRDGNVPLPEIDDEGDESNQSIVTGGVTADALRHGGVGELL